AVGNLRAEAVRIFDHLLRSVPKAQTQAVGLRVAFEQRDEKPLGMLLRHRASLAVVQHLGGLRLGQESADFPARLVTLLAHAVGSEHAERIPVISADDRFHLLRGHESLKNKYGRFPFGIAQIGASSPPRRFGGTRNAARTRSHDPARRTPGALYLSGFRCLPPRIRSGGQAVADA